MKTERERMYRWYHLILWTISFNITQRTAKDARTILFASNNFSIRSREWYHLRDKRERENIGDITWFCERYRSIWSKGLTVWIILFVLNPSPIGAKKRYNLKDKRGTGDGSWYHLILWTISFNPTKWTVQHYIGT